MAKKKPGSGPALTKNGLYEAEITGMTLDGNGICRVDGFTMFVPLAAPGDRIRLKAVKLQKNYGFGIIDQVLTPSPARIKPGCPVYKQCGGCSFRHIDYREELRLKEQTVADAFARIGGFTVCREGEELLPGGVRMEPILGGGEDGLSADHYRNKAQYPLAELGGKLRAGFYARRSHRLIPAEDCPLQDPAFAPVVRDFVRIAGQLKIPAYDELTGKGLLRHLFLRKGRATGELMVCIVAAASRFKGRETLVSRLVEAHPEITGIVLNINPEKTNVILGRETVCLYGRDYLEDVFLNMRFAIAPEAFYQVNAEQAARLYKEAFRYAGFTGEETLLDLYCGIGSIGLSALPEVKKLIGVEVVPQAARSARQNAVRNGVADRAEFFCADAAEAARKLAEEGLRPDVIIIDPPRKGCDHTVLDSITRMGPEKVVMISCNPSTAARDAQILCDGEHGYRLERFRAVDMFPRCGHCESVSLFIKCK